MNPFEYNDAPTNEQLEQMAAVRQGCKALADIFLALPNSRERSLAMTQLEQAAMWANKGIAHSTQGQR